MHLSPLLQNLIQSLRCLPGVGPKTAQRMAFHLLQQDRVGARRLIEAVSQALEDVGYCEQCRMLSEETLCPICSNPKRDQTVLCVVESPADVLAVENSQQYRGLYFVLMGRLSPLDGVGPEDIGMDKLSERLKKEGIREIILATNPTVEGEATAHYISEMAKQQGVIASRIAHGVPVGGELEYVDTGTLAQALAGRRAY